MTFLTLLRNDKIKKDLQKTDISPVLLYPLYKRCSTLLNSFIIMLSSVSGSPPLPQQVHNFLLLISSPMEF